MKHQLALFEESGIRKVYKNNKWYYSIQDVITKFVDTTEPNQYVKKLKNKDPELANKWEELSMLFNMQTKDGKVRKVQASDTVGILRIIESIPTKKAEDFKIWLAKLGFERLEEINNPELAMDRMKQIYQMKGYSNSWIEQREREITTRHSLKEEWKNKGIEEDKDYNILMKEIYENTFGIDIEKYQSIKGIEEEIKLKDHMTNLELAILNLNENIILEFHKKNKSQSYKDIKKDIHQSSKIINKTTKEIETILDKSIISSINHSNLTNSK